MPNTPSLHTALQREREAAEKRRAIRLPDAWDAFGKEYEIACEATDQALAALEERPTLAEVEAAIAKLEDRGPLLYLCGVRDALAEVRALYARGGER